MDLASGTARKLTGTALAVLFAGATAFAQTQDPVPSLRHMPDPMTSDLSVSTFAQLTPNRVTNAGETVQGSAPSIGVLGTFHQQLKPLLGYSVNMGYSRTAENFLSIIRRNPGHGTTGYTEGSLGTDMFELSGSVVLHAPRFYHRFVPFGQFGAGVLSFLPTLGHQPDSVNFRLTGIFGAGADYRFNRRFGLRLEYRGMLYKNPDLRYSGDPSTLVTSKNYTVTSEPTIGITYSFRPRRHELQ